MPAITIVRRKRETRVIQQSDKLHLCVREKKTTTAGGDKTHNIAQFHTPKEDGNLLDDLENKKQSML